MSRPWPGGRIEPAEERRRLLVAFVELVAEGGIDAADRGSVCARAGLGRRAFERHFVDRPTCFDAAWDWLKLEYLGRLEAALAPHEGWRQRLRAGAGETLRLVGEHPQQARFLAVESLALEAGRSRQRALGDRIAQRLDGFRAELVDPSGPPAATSSWVVGLFFDRIYRCLSAGEEQALPAQLPQLLFLAVSAYSGTEAGLEELRAPPP
ncbi:MAG: hypothetical protein QOE75_1364 [Solirubrobacterales bacterium]|nr:hypothetical protein [Solirubrobacterales bacterium]